jgi:large subunit ribosomal protein L23
MLKKTPYSIIKSRYLTEKANVLQSLKSNESNPCVKRCTSPKYIFKVASWANKAEIAQAVEQIYAEKNIKVVAVNTINVKPKARRVRGMAGFRSGYKKAIVTLEKGDVIEDNI